MSYKNSNKDELLDLVAFYTVDVKVADEESGPTKKELLAALTEANVTDEDYQTFKEAKAAGTDKSREEKLAEAAAKAAEEEEQDEADEEPEPVDTSDYVLVKMERKNPSYEVSGVTFTQRHPFASVPPHVASYLVKQTKGFRLALPEEVTDYYN